MPQQSNAYAVGRVSVLLRERLDAAGRERLLSASSLQDALRALQDMGFSDQAEDYEHAASVHVRKAYAFVRQVSPDPRITDCFLIRFDIHNLKMLLKARCLSQMAQHLSSSGLYPIEQLRHAVEERRYAFLPQAIRQAMEVLESRLAVHEDPLDIDVSLDKAMFQWIADSMLKIAEPCVKAYFAAKADIQCAIMLLRVMRMGKGSAYFRQFLLPGGTIGEEEWIDAFEQPQRLPTLLSRYGVKVVAAVRSAVEGSSLPAVEKAMDDYLLNLYTNDRKNPESIEPLIAYLLLREREAAAIRLILAGKANGFTPEAVRERLREMYA